MDKKLGGGGRGREAETEREGEKRRKNTNQGERRERYLGRNTERQGEGKPQSHRPSISSPQSHPCIPKAAREQRAEAAAEPTAQGPQRLPPLSPFRGCPPPAPGARSLAIAGLTQCAPLTASPLPAPSRQAPGTVLGAEDGMGAGEGGLR